MSPAILDKPDCTSGKSCGNQKDPGEWPLSPVCDLTLTSSSTQITHESVRSHPLSPGDVILNNPFLFPVNHMIDTVTEKPPEPIAGPSHTSANAGTVLGHNELEGIRAN